MNIYEHFEYVLYWWFSTYRMLKIMTENFLWKTVREKDHLIIQIEYVFIHFTQMYILPQKNPCNLIYIVIFNQSKITFIYFQ